MAETKKYVRIKKATREAAWYADKIGQIFEVECVGPTYLIRTGPNPLSAIRKEDAELFVTENRRPQIGERVLITYGITSSGDYKTGDICTVRSVVDIYGTITVKEHGNYVIAREYEVIVNNEIKNEEADRMKIDLNAMGYDELIAHGEDVIRAIRLRAYGEGYRQGKFDAEMDYTHGQAPIVSAQARRDEIVEQAKADVAKLIEDAGSSVRVGYGNFTLRHRMSRVEFVVNREKRTVVALVFGKIPRFRNELREKGIAKAAPDDCFNAHIGKAIALRRALGLAVPDEYLNAPQPTEIRVGDVVCGNRGDDHYYSKNKTFTITSDSVERITDGFLYKENTDDWIEREQIGRIIDDSREEVGS